MPVNPDAVGEKSIGRLCSETLSGLPIGSAPRGCPIPKIQMTARGERIAQLVRDAHCPVLVGHSFGASTLLRFVAQAEPQLVFRGLFLVATPFWGKEDFPDFALTAEHLRRLRSISPLFFYQSSDDPVVGLTHFQKYQESLPHAIFRRLDGRGHEFDQETFPELVADIRSVTGELEP